MPCCSAYDALSAPIATPLATDPTTTTTLAGDPLSAGTTADAAAAGTDAAATDAAATDAAAAGVPAGFDCRNDQCFEFLAGRAACPTGRCRRDQDGKVVADHPRPRCPVHDRPRPFGVDTK